MRYADAAALVFAQRRADGRATVPLASLILARAVDALDPGQLDAAGGDFFFRGARLWSYQQTLAQLTAAPGVYFRFPHAEPNESLDVAVSGAPPANPGALLGPLNRRFMAQLASLLRSRVAPLGLIPAERIAQLVGLGVIALPASGARLRIVRPDTPAEMLGPANGGEAWALVVEEFRRALDEYASKHMAAGWQALADSEASIARWERIQSLLETVRDLPSTVASAAAGAAVDVAGGVLRGLGPAQLILYAALGLGAVLVLNRGRILAAVLRGGR